MLSSSLNVVLEGSIVDHLVSTNMVPCESSTMVVANPEKCHAVGSVLDFIGRKIAKPELSGGIRVSCEGIRGGGVGN
jgi:hypothetical protein